MLWAVLAVVFFIALFWYLFIKPLSYWSNKGVKQGHPWPILGDSWQTFFQQKSGLEFIKWLYDMHPNERYIGMYEFSTPALMIRDPELIKQIAIKDFDHFTDHRNRSFANPDKDPLSMGNLFVLKGQRWREMRAALSGSFTSSKMKIIFGVMEKTSTNFIQYFLNKNQDLLDVELKDSFTRVANDVIATAAFGIEVDSLKEPKNTFYLVGRKLTNFGDIWLNIKFMIYFLLPKVAKFFEIAFIDPQTVKYFENIIYDTIKQRQEKGIVRPDMINLLLETRKGINHEENEIIDTGFATAKEFTTKENFNTAKQLTDQEIAAQAFVFFLAGFDTISTALCFGCYELSINKDVQDKLRKEIKETHKANNKQVTYESLMNMKYLDMVVSETLRKWAPTIFMDRICTKPYTIQPVNPGEKPVHIEKGELIYLPFHGIHRDPKFYPNPDKFDPERFSVENKDKIVPYTFLPFGVGLRNCIGSRFAILEMKVVFYKLFLNFEIVPTAKTDIPLKLAKGHVVNTAENGFWMGLNYVKN